MIDFYFDDDKAGERLAGLRWTACSWAGRGMQRQPGVKSGGMCITASCYVDAVLSCTSNYAHATLSCFTRLPRGL